MWKPKPMISELLSTQSLWNRLSCLCYINYMFRRSKLTNKILPLTFLAVFSIGLFSAYHVYMPTGPDGEMGACPFTQGTSICVMTPVQHIAAAQNIFHTLPWQKDLLSVFLLAIFLALPLYFLLSSSPPRNLLNSFSKRNQNLSFIHTLQELFSQGILNPKIY